MKHESHETHETDETHEAHETHETHETDTALDAHTLLRPRRLHVASPLSDETEAIITRIIGCAIAVHKALGPGFLESIYKKAMCIEMNAQQLAYEKERRISVAYRGIQIPGQRVDLIVENQVVVELKAVARLDEIHRGQVISYLRTTGLRAGLLMNFRVRYLPDGLRRVVV